MQALIRKLQLEDVLAATVERLEHIPPECCGQYGSESYSGSCDTQHVDDSAPSANRIPESRMGEQVQASELLQRRDLPSCQRRDRVHHAEVSQVYVTIQPCDKPIHVLCLHQRAGSTRYVTFSKTIAYQDTNNVISSMEALQDKLGRGILHTA